MLYTQEGCNKLHTCFVSTRSVLSHMEKILSVEDKRKYGSKIWVPDMLQNCTKTWRGEGRGKKKTNNKIKKAPNPHSDQLQQANKYLNEKQSFSLVTAGNRVNVGTYCRKKQKRPQKCNRPIMEVTRK